MYKEIASTLAIIITLVAFMPYLTSTLFGQTKPHIFSWIIWGITTTIVFLAQLEAKGGIGAWPIGVSGGVTLLIAVLAFIKRADVSITTSDWLFFIIALSSIPIWFFTSDPFWAVAILTTVDVIGFVPTIRKSWHAPHSEPAGPYGLFVLRNALVIIALEHYSFATVLFPAVIALVCLLVMIMLLYRRQVLATQAG